MPSLNETFCGLILLGQHARAGTLNGFLDHTIDSSAWFEYRINGQVVGEIGIEAAYAGHYNLPVIAVSGDECAAREARDLLGDVECAVVKWGIGRNRARCLSPVNARNAIGNAIQKALSSMDRFRPYKPSLPATLQLTLYRSDMADELASRPGVERIDARTVSKKVCSLMDVCRW
jgi:D-amino peptidase